MNNVASTAFPLRGSLAHALAAVLLIVAAVACGEKSATGGKTPGEPATAKTAKAPTQRPPAPDGDPRQKLADAYHDVRCMLSGQRRPDDALYTKLGFLDGAAFSTAFTEAATEDGPWAARAIARSLEQSCQSD